MRESIDLAIDGWIYGYIYYTPTPKRQKDRFNIAFVQWVGGRWHLAGFYLNAEYVADGAPSPSYRPQTARGAGADAAEHWSSPRASAPLTVTDIVPSGSRGRLDQLA
jgi:hypothetical protein